jgi:hypothetical protein
MGASSLSLAQYSRCLAAQQELWGHGSTAHIYDNVPVSHIGTGAGSGRPLPVCRDLWQALACPENDRFRDGPLGVAEGPNMETRCPAVRGASATCPYSFAPPSPGQPRINSGAERMQAVGCQSATHPTILARRIQPSLRNGHLGILDFPPPTRRPGQASREWRLNGQRSRRLV